MFEKYLKRVEPKDVSGIQTASSNMPLMSSHEVRAVGRKRSKSRSSNMDKSLRLSAEQKCDIAQREIEELREDIERLKDDSEKVLDTFRVGTLLKPYNSDFLKILLVESEKNAKESNTVHNKIPRIPITCSVYHLCM